MSTLKDLLETHQSALILDAASAIIQVGWMTAGEAETWRSCEAEAGAALFSALEPSKADVNTVGAFVFCEGPGSILGVRTAAAAIRAWCVLRDRPVYAYSSLALVGAALASPDTAVIADARRELWHVQETGKPLRRVLSADLPERLVMPDGFRNWSALPARVRRVPYDVASMLRTTRDVALLHRTDAPEAFMHEQPNYVTWTPQIHRAPTAS